MAQMEVLVDCFAVRMRRIGRAQFPEGSYFRSTEEVEANFLGLERWRLNLRMSPVMSFPHQIIGTTPCKGVFKNCAEP